MNNYTVNALEQILVGVIKAEDDGFYDVNISVEEEELITNLQTDLLNAYEDILKLQKLKGRKKDYYNEQNSGLYIDTYGLDLYE